MIELRKTGHDISLILRIKLIFGCVIRNLYNYSVGLVSCFQMKQILDNKRLYSHHFFACAERRPETLVNYLCYKIGLSRLVNLESKFRLT
jgi:hypothetical protein